MLTQYNEQKMEKALMAFARKEYIYGESSKINQPITKVACTDGVLRIPSFVFFPYSDKILEAMKISTLSVLQADYSLRNVNPALRFLLGFEEFVPKKAQRQLKKWGISLSLEDGKIVAKSDQVDKKDPDISIDKDGIRKLYNSCALNTIEGKRYINAATEANIEILPQDNRLMCCAGSIILGELTKDEASEIFGIPINRIQLAMNSANVTKPGEMKSIPETTTAQSLNDDNRTKPESGRGKRKKDNISLKIKKGKIYPGFSAEYKVTTSPVSEEETCKIPDEPQVQEEPNEATSVLNQNTLVESQHMEQNCHFIPIDFGYDGFDTPEHQTFKDALEGPSTFMGATHSRDVSPLNQNTQSTNHSCGSQTEFRTETEACAINTTPPTHLEQDDLMLDEIFQMITAPGFSNTLDWSQF